MNDPERVKTVEQTILRANGEYDCLRAWLKAHRVHKVFLVCDSAFRYLKISRFLEEQRDFQIVRFDHIQPNPVYECVEEGVALFRKERCDVILAVGGGSPMDVAKCIKLYAEMDPGVCYLKQAIVPNVIPLIAMPTTAGTGSEATRYAVIYYEGEKQSIADVSCIPSVVVMDPTVLETLPDYQRKSTMLDAFCHAVESWWSVHADETSRALSAAAIRQWMSSREAYLANTSEGNEGMLQAAHLAGQAINLTQTTAGHAMAYKLTSLYGVAHGHAAALCVRRLWPWMIGHTDRCIDPRGRAALDETFLVLAHVMGCDGARQAAELFNAWFEALELLVPALREEQLPLLCRSVNPVRLKNNPVSLEGETENLYRQILKG